MIIILVNLSWLSCYVGMLELCALRLLLIDGLSSSPSPVFRFLGTDLLPRIAVHLYPCGQQPYRLVAVAHCLRAEGLWARCACGSRAYVHRASSGAHELRDVDGLSVGAVCNAPVSVHEDRPSLSALAHGHALCIAHAFAHQILARIHGVVLHLDRRRFCHSLVAVHAGVPVAAPANDSAVRVHGHHRA